RPDGMPPPDGRRGVSNCLVGERSPKASVGLRNRSDFQAPSLFSTAPLTASKHLSATTMAAGREASCYNYSKKAGGQGMDVVAWPRARGLDHYARVFLATAVAPAVLPRLTTEALQTPGTRKIGDRRKLLDAIAALHRKPDKPRELPEDAER